MPTVGAFARVLPHPFPAGVAFPLRALPKPEAEGQDDEDDEGEDHEKYRVCWKCHDEWDGCVVG